MRFRDRSEAGEALAEALGSRLDPSDAIVLGLARGGVVVGSAVARRLELPLDVVVPRKLGAPNNPELGIGAIAPGVRVLDERTIAMLGVPPGYIEREVERQSEEIDRRSSVYRGGRSPIPLEGRHAVLVDDGVATGGTAVASIRWARVAGAARVTFAAPVAAPPAIARLEAEADDVVVLAAPHAFGSVGQWYERFDQTRDAEVVSLLAGEPQHT